MPRTHKRIIPGSRRYADHPAEALKKCLDEIREGRILQRAAAEKYQISCSGYSM